MPEAETRTEVEKQTSKAGFWLEEIQKAGKREHDWRKEGKEIVARYKNEKKRARSLNILWANTELLKPATLARTPKPDVRQRFPIEQPVAKAAADILEKALAFIADDPAYGLIEQLEYARDDMLLPGRGVCRVIYERDIRREILQDDSTADGKDEEGRPYREEITRQEVYPCHVYWEDYREGDARCWEDVPWIAYRHTYTRKQLKKAFGDKGSLVPLNLGSSDGKGDDNKDDKDPENPLQRAIVWEVWDKAERNRLWVAESYKDDVLAEDGDPLNLESFFPQSDPLYGIRTTDCRVPVPEFRIYKDQADELDDISLRIKRLVDACKVRGIYAAVMKEAADLLNGDENELFPVEDWAALKDRGGLEGSIAWLPIEQIANVIAALYTQREQLKAEIYELTGISDLLRGDTDPDETATAQQIKGNFGNLRLEPRQVPVQRFARDIFRLCAEIMAEHFTAEHLMEMTGEQEPQPPMVEVPVDPMAQQMGGQPQEPQMMPDPNWQPEWTWAQVMELLRSDKLRNFNVDIETDSTVAPDEEAEKRNVTEFMSATAEFFKGLLEPAVAIPQLMPLSLEIFRASAKRFKMGRELDETIDQTVDSITEQAEQPQEPEPDPELMKIQAEMEANKQKAQVDLQANQQKMQLEMQKMQADMQMAREKHQLEMQMMQAKLQAMQQEMGMKQQMKADEMAMKREANAEQMQFDRAAREDEMKFERESRADNLAFQRENQKMKMKQQQSAARNG